MYQLFYHKIIWLSLNVGQNSGIFLNWRCLLHNLRTKFQIKCKVLQSNGRSLIWINVTCGTLKLDTYMWNVPILKIFNESECVIRNKIFCTGIGWKAYERVRPVSESVITATFTRKENHALGLHATGGTLSDTMRPPLQAMGVW